jgi:hypothetical protein
VASLTAAQLYELDGGRLALYLVTGRRNRASGNHYPLEEIETRLRGQAFRLMPFRTNKLAAGETDYVVLLGGPGSSCTCPGCSYTGRCKHLSAILAFQAERRQPGRDA